jgi:hypothetical protein
MGDTRTETLNIHSDGSIYGQYVPLDSRLHTSLKVLNAGLSDDQLRAWHRVTNSRSIGIGRVAIADT